MKRTALEISDELAIGIETLPLTKTDRHQRICEGLNEIYRKKNEDYGDSFGKLFKEYGESYAAAHIEEKLVRFKQLMKNPPQVKHESKIDSLLDMANYCILTVIELEEK
jgi:hypothetical protein